MKTMYKLCDLFNRKFPGYEAVFDGLEAHRGYYPVYIGSKRSYYPGTRYVFKSAREFREWINGVFMDA